jgi:hypothetical protein
VTQLLGINDAAIAVGFYQVTPTDITHGLTYDPSRATRTHSMIPTESEVRC